jgi:hypothetical protein
MEPNTPQTPLSFDDHNKPQTIADIAIQFMEYKEVYYDEEAVREEVATWTRITAQDFKTLYETYSRGPKNLCVECGIDMGEQNLRQLCGKTYCLYQ